MNLRPKLTAEQAAANLAEKEPAYSAQEARVEADRCLYCYDAPCIMACPTGIDIPGFIQKISTGNLTGSARTILESNILGNSCARVCPTSVLCEGACVLEDRDKKPIKIGRLQRFATDHVLQNNIQVVKPAAEKSGKKVALVGGGPASLGCAAELVRLGHDAVIFEKKPAAGGLNTYGIAVYKMAPQVSIEEVEMIKGLGVEIRESVEVGKDITMDELRKDYDAVFLGIGLGGSRRLGFPGEDLLGVVEAVDFIEQLHRKPLDQVAVGEHVVVLGCGNTAIDALVQSKKLGATTATIAYRRGEADMSAYPFEYEWAKQAGCQFEFDASPMEVLSDNGAITGMRLARADGSEFTLPADMVILSLGQSKMRETLAGWLPDLELDPRGVIVVDPLSSATNIEGVYAGGDAANGGAEVVNAVADGKKAALDMHQKFTGETINPPVQTTRYGEEKAFGSGFENPVRAPELEAAYFLKKER